MSNPKYFIGIDVGASKIEAGLVSDKKILKRIKLPTEKELGKKGVIKNIITAINETYLPEVKGIGIGIAGQIDQKNGIVISSPNLPQNFKKIKLKKIIERKFKKPVKVENDANCFTLAEGIYGAGENYKYVIGLTLGTGIGGGIVLDKKIYQGKDGFAGELGHITIVEDGLPCSCGQKGHLEVYASAQGMINLYKKFTGQKKDTFFIEKQAKKKNKIALQVLQIMSEILADGLANLINIFNPDLIVLGGGLAKVDILVIPAIKLAKKRVVYPQLAKTKIIRAKLKENAHILGATLLFKNPYF